MPDPNIVPVGTALDVIFGLSARARDVMADCLANELDPLVNPAVTVPLEGLECIVTVLSNGWAAVFREESSRDIFHPLGMKVIILYDLLPPESAIASGLGLLGL